MASFRFRKIYLGESSTISSKNEKINTKFSLSDYFDGEKTSESAQEKMIKKVLDDINSTNNIDTVIGADLSNQLAITNKVMTNYKLPFLGVYSACSSYTEQLICAGTLLGSTSLKNIACIISSHNLSSERTFRYPIEYGSPRRITQTFTSTGAVASIVTKIPTNIKLESCTIGKVVDYGIKDVNNMGAIMAPGAADTLICHLNDFKRDVNYYDVILTGDLGLLGTELFMEILKKHDITLKNHIDSGSILITDKSLTDQGASGPICLPLVLIEKILKEKKYKKILLIDTGALHNTTILNQKMSIPCISHAVSLEVIS